MDLVGQLIKFNLTRQEAAIYTTLYTNGELTGYEAAKLTGISRSNTYASLAALVEKGAAYVIEGSVTRYAPVAVEEFCNNRIKNLLDIKQSLVEHMPQKREKTEGYMTIKGKSHILDKMKNMVSAAQERVYASLSCSNLETIRDELEQALLRGIKLVIITNEPFKLEGATIYYGANQQHQIRLIADSTNVLTGDVAHGENSSCLYSRKKNLVDLFKDSLRNEIKLIELTKGSGLS